MLKIDNTQVIILIWTEEKENYLKNNWNKYNDEELGEQLGTTAQAINAKRRRLKLFRKTKVKHNVKIYTYNEVKQLFENRNYILLEKVYTNYTTKMNYICKKHPSTGVQQINLADLLRGRGCSPCGRERTLKSIKHPDNYWEKICLERNLIFIDTYIKNK